MAVLSTYALIDFADFQEEVDVSGEKEKTRVERLINRASASIETYLGRDLITRGALTEYHTANGSAIYTLDYPIIAVTQIAEDAARAYGASTVLDFDDGHYILNKASGRIARAWAGAGPRQWLGGYRAIRIQYTAGYASRATVPEDIKDICLGLVARRWKEIVQGLHSYQSRSDATGNVDRILPADLTRVEKEALSTLRRWDHLQTGERDAA